MDDVSAAVANEGALDHVAEFVLRHAGPRAGDERRHSGIAQGRADAQPRDLLLGLDEPQLDVIGIEADELEFRLQRLPSRAAERPDHADASAAAPREFLDDLGDALFLAPTHVGIARHLARQRQVIVVLDEHHHALAGPEQQQRLRGAGPTRHPARRVADILHRDDKHMVRARRRHGARDAGMATGILGIGKTRIALFEDRSQVGGKPERRGRQTGCRAICALSRA
jgi:hypothetical protein